MKRRILIVEDDGDVRSVLREQLDADGWHVEVAGAIHEALAVLSGTAVDLVLLGIALRDKRDLPAVLALRRATRAPIVAMTGSAVGALPRDLPVEAVLTKPFSVGDLGPFARARGSTAPSARAR